MAVVVSLGIPTEIVLFKIGVGLGAFGGKKWNRFGWDMSFQHVGRKIVKRAGTDEANNQMWLGHLNRGNGRKDLFQLGTDLRMVTKEPSHI